MKMRALRDQHLRNYLAKLVRRFGVEYYRAHGQGD